ncbi:hypothetical protein GQS40_12100|uniref:Tr-type G domain-containing protein n=1 Tax=Leuconostoc lactis TaxID=1246 RepID=A0A6L7A7W9_LEULA|nr:hypothetical protein [Leuconostoc lactis]
MENFQEQLKNRRTFAIISHPDAGKTTLTEQLLLHGGVIREAGTVKGRGSNKLASSDWMAVLAQPIGMTAADTALLHARYPENYRDVQALAGREILYVSGKK